MDSILKAAEWILNSKHTTAMTGAGISVESGIPPFRGENGLWNTYDPLVLELDYFREHTQKSWEVIKQIFYDYFGTASPNTAHITLAEMQEMGILHTLITQNIDNLHRLAGSKDVLEFHGTSGAFVCMNCGRKIPTENIAISGKAPRCSECGGLLKPDFIFFGEHIPEPAASLSYKAAEKSDVFIIIGTTGEVMPASYLPIMAKKKGAFIIEVNLKTSNYTDYVTDLFLQGKATDVLSNLLQTIKNMHA